MEEKRLSYPVVHLEAYEPVTDEIIAILPADFVRKRLIIPLQVEKGRLLVAVPKTEGVVKPEGVAILVKMPVDFVLAPIDEIIAFIKIHYSDDSVPDTTTMNLVVGGVVPDLAQKHEFANLTVDDVGDVVTSPSFNLEPILKKVLLDAAINRATEILISVQGDKVQFRERIRGNVVNADKHLPISKDDVENLFKWFKKAGDYQYRDDLEWAELRREIQIRNDKYYTYFFLSRMPEGSYLTIRFHQKKEQVFSPASWGMDPGQARVFGEFLEKRQGFVLFCGTDQHGVDDNLMASANMLATPNRHVIAVEDFPHTWVSGIEHFAAKGSPSRFSHMLEIACQHAPDVIVANPLCVKNHFELCLQEAIKGRFILGRSYAMDAADAVVQLLEEGIEPYLLGSGLIGVVAKRTLRINCPRCQMKDPNGRSQAKEIGIPVAMQPASFYVGKGCDACDGSGFSGDTDIFEVFPMTDEVRLQLKKESKPDAFRNAIRSKGLLTLRQIALHKAINGQTSLAEVIRTTPK